MIQLHGGEKGFNFDPYELKETLKHIILSAPNLRFDFESDVQIEIALKKE